MSFHNLLQIGDDVVITIDAETRALTNTYDSLPNGTRGVVCGFYDAINYQERVPVYARPPGAYYSKGIASVWLSDGRVVDGNGFALVDEDERKRRDLAMREYDGMLRNCYIRLGDLPATTFWEHDKVRVTFPGEEPLEMMISGIRYGDMHSVQHDGSPYPFYDVAYAGGGTGYAKESWIELIERGNVWKYYNDQPLTFEGIEEEADFFKLVGQTEQVRNPRGDTYSWGRDEVLEAIRNGTVHGFSVSQGFFGSGPSIQAYRYHDDELGQRVAQATLEGFGVSTS